MTDVVTLAKGWIGVPFRHAGRSRQGVDCIGLVIKVAHEAGISSFDTTDYSRRPVPSEFVQGCKEHLDRILLDDAGSGDIGVFAEPRTPCHVGLIERDTGGRRWVIHAYAPARKVIYEPLVGDRLSRMIMAFRFKTA